MLQVDNSPDYPDVRCFWLVRTDGSETDFSYRKCLREKVVREFPTFIDRYDELYLKKPPPAPAVNSTEEVTPVDQAEKTDTQAGTLQRKETQAGSLQETDSQVDSLEEDREPGSLLERAPTTQVV